MGENAIRELAGHGFRAFGPIVEGRDQREDRRSGVGSTVHVADVDFVERRFTNAEHKRALLLEADIGGAFYKVRCDSVGNPRESANAARDDDHGFGRVRSAGDVGSDVGIGLLLDFLRRLAKELANEVAPTAYAKFFRQNA